MLDKLSASRRGRLAGVLAERGECGQTTTEYALVGVLISIAAVGVFATIGGDLLSAFQGIVDAPWP